MKHRHTIRVTAWVLETLLFIACLPLFGLIILPLRLRRAWKRYHQEKPWILWAPIPIINIHYNALADRTQGYRSDTLVYNPYHITQGSLFDYNLQRWYRRKVFWLIMPPIVFLWAVLRYDIFQFFYIGGFFYYYPPIIARFEWPLLRAMGKGIVVMPYGADVRLESVTRRLGKYHAYMDMSHEQVVSEVGVSEKKIATDVKNALRWANIPVSMGDMLEYTPGSRNDIFHWAIDTRRWQPVFETRNQKVVILHAPNHPHYKGTRFLLPVIKRLEREGYPIEFVLVRGLSNEQAMELYKRADIAAEQFIIGWHGFFAIEAMALGKPVLCYIRRHTYLPSWTPCPIVNTNPDTLYDTLVRLILNPEERVSLGRAGRRYVEEVYSLEKAGARYAQLYREIWSSNRHA